MLKIKLRKIKPKTTPKAINANKIWPTEIAPNKGIEKREPTAPEIALNINIKKSLHILKKSTRPTIAPFLQLHSMTKTTGENLINHYKSTDG